MLLQVRSDGGDICTTCGATELLVETGSGSELSASLKPALERLLASAESKLLELWALDQQERETAVQASNAQLVMRVRELAPKQARPYRVFKRRWQRQLEAEVEKAVKELLGRTRFV